MVRADEPAERAVDQKRKAVPEADQGTGRNETGQSGVPGSLCDGYHQSGGDPGEKGGY